MTARISKLLSFLQENPNDCFINHALGLEYLKEGDVVSAEKHFQHNMNVDPGYVATYYHLGKLFEQTGQKEKAIDTYLKGMELTKSVKDIHTYNELQAAYEDLVY